MIKLNIEDSKNNVTYTMFMYVPNGTIFKYQEDYYLRIEGAVVRDFLFNDEYVVNCVKLLTGELESLNNNAEVLIPSSKLVIN